MLEQKVESTRSIARKLAREILPEEIEVIAAGAGTITLDGTCDCPGDMDQGFIA